MHTLSLQQIAYYLDAYFQRYRIEYDKLTGAPPEGAGLPPIGRHPALDNSPITCHVTEDGAILVDQSRAPDYDWAIAGGPAFMVDRSKSRVPVAVSAIRERVKAAQGSPVIGISRIVSDTVPDDVWNGVLPDILERYSHITAAGKPLYIQRFNSSLRDVLRRLTFGALGDILDLQLPDPESELWQNRVMIGIGTFTADMLHKRFFRYLEIVPHLDPAAWDNRSIWVRAYVDVRNNIALRMNAQNGGTIQFPGPPPLFVQFRDRLSAFNNAIGSFRELLSRTPSVDEGSVHDFFVANPTILDLYGHVISKPRFRYPEYEGPTGKLYVEPDFLVVYPNETYQIIEIERPSKQTATQAGQPRAEVTQAVYQIAEFRDYIQRHYGLIRERFPGIVSSCTYCVVIGRETEAFIKEKADSRRYMTLLTSTYNADHLWTYDDVLTRANEAYIRLSALSAGS